MPIIKSAIKRAKQTEVRRKRNLQTKAKIRSTYKQVVTLIDGKKLDKAGESLAEAYSALDTAVKKNLIHKNRAARKKSQLAKAYSKAGGKPVKGEPKKVAKKPATTTKKAVTKKPATKKPAAKKPAKKAE